MIAMEGECAGILAERGTAGAFRWAGRLLHAAIFGNAEDRAASVGPRRAAAGPSRSASFDDLVLPHLDSAYNLARFLTRDADAADDIVQDAMLRAFRAFHGFRGGEPRAWLLAIVRNGVRDWAQARHRDRMRFETLSPEAEEGTDIPDAGQPTPEDHLVVDSEARRIRSLVEALPVAFREVLVLREFEDLSYRQIAEIAGIPIGTVMSRLARGREMVAAAWRRETGDHATTGGRST